MTRWKVRNVFIFFIWFLLFRGHVDPQYVTYHLYKIYLEIQKNHRFANRKALSIRDLYESQVRTLINRCRISGKICKYKNLEKPLLKSTYFTELYASYVCYNVIHFKHDDIQFNYTYLDFSVEVDSISHFDLIYHSPDQVNF